MPVKLAGNTSPIPPGQKREEMNLRSLLRLTTASCWHVNKDGRECETCEVLLQTVSL